jgi:hypothetical protein
MRCNILSPLPCLVLPKFSILPHKQHDFRKTLLNIKCVLIFSTTEIFLILRRIQQDIITIVRSFSCKVPIILTIF